MTRLFFLAVALSGTAVQASAQDAAMGHMLAEEYCAACHDISPEGLFKQVPPSFAAIAVFRSDRQIQDRIEYPPMHAAMPRYTEYMIANNVGDMVAYIRSLEPSGSD